MLISKEVKMRWNSKNKRFYEDKGYTYTKMRDEFYVRVEDLKEGSNVKIQVKCDYCGNIYEVQYYSWKKLKEKDNNSDCCSNPECTGEKSLESLEIKYGDNFEDFRNRQKEKREQTNLEKYGYVNPFQNELIKSKIRETNIEKYGVPVVTQNPEIREKGTQTCLEKYGVPNYGAIYSQSHKGNLSPRWKGEERITERTERYDPVYKDWRKSVFERDYYTCQCCGAKSQNGQGSVFLEAHHLNNFKDYIEERYDINNGVTLCRKCHKEFHSIYGIKHTNYEDYQKFILNKQIDKKVC